MKYLKLFFLFSDSTNITGLCYVRPIKTIWVAAGSTEAAMFDPKSGDNVSTFVGKLGYRFN